MKCRIRRRRSVRIEQDWNELHNIILLVYGADGDDDDDEAEVWLRWKWGVIWWGY